MACSLTSILAIAGLSAAGCDPSVPRSLPQTIHIEVTGEEFEWNVRYAGQDETLRTADDLFTKRHITLLQGTPTIVDLRSKDYLYSFALPHLGLKEIAVPELKFSLNFCPDQQGEFLLKGDQLCGYQHPNLLGRVQVLSAEDFAHWQHQAERQGDGERE